MLDGRSRGGFAGMVAGFYCRVRLSWGVDAAQVPGRDPQLFPPGSGWARPSPEFARGEHRDWRSRAVCFERSEKLCCTMHVTGIGMPVCLLGHFQQDEPPGGVLDADAVAHGRGADSRDAC